MNTKNNRRKRESCQKISRAFLEFLKTKELSQIKVSEICKVANINRSTFYAAYDDVYDLADKIRKELEEDVNRLFKEEERFNSGADSFLRLLCHIRDNQDLFSFYFKLGYDDRTLKLYNVCDFRDILKEKYIDYHVEFFKNGFNAIVKLWLENGCRESPEEICEILLCEYRGRF